MKELDLIKKNYPTVKVKKFNISEHSAIEEFINSLEDDDDVQKVYANFDSKNN